MQGAAQKKSATPWWVGGWVRGQKRTRVKNKLWIFFNGVFELPSLKNAQKRDKQKFKNKIVLD
jgi:hypothetical protein